MIDPAGRVPPNDLDAEAAVLSACLLSADALAEVADVLKPGHFYSDANGAIFAACLALMATGAAVDVVTVSAHLRAADRLQLAGGASYLAQVVDATPATAHVGDHARVVVETARMRELIATCQRIAAEAYGDVGDRQEFIDAAEAAIYAIAHTDTRNEAQHIKPVLAEAFQEIADAAERGDQIIGTPTGYRKLDRAIAGLCDGDLIVVAARPGMGKTALALNIAANVAETSVPGDSGPVRRGVGVFSLEMPKGQVSTRMACSRGRVDVGALRRGEMSTADWAQLTAASAELSAMPIWIDDTSGLTLLDLRARARRMASTVSRHDPPARLAAVVVDYLQLMGGSGRKGANRENEISEISRGLKTLAKELGVPVVGLSQLNRGCELRGEDKRPRLSDIRESGAVEQDADTVLMIYRDEYYNPETTQDRGLAEVHIMKQRNGPPGKVMLRWFGASTCFCELEQADYDQWEDYHGA